MTQINKFDDLNGRFASLETEMTRQYKFRDRWWTLLYSTVLPEHMSGGLVFGLMAINVSLLFPFLCKAMCRCDRGREDFKLMYHLIVTALKSIKLPFSKKRFATLLMSSQS